MYMSVIDRIRDPQTFSRRFSFYKEIHNITYTALSLLHTKTNKMTAHKKRTLFFLS